MFTDIWLIFHFFKIPVRVSGKKRVHEKTFTLVCHVCTFEGVFLPTVKLLDSSADEVLIDFIVLIDSCCSHAVRKDSLPQDRGQP